MKVTRLLTTMITGFVLMSSTFAQPAPVDSFMVDPMYPTADQAITIYINANHWNLTTDDGNLSAWTGLITNASAEPVDDWRHNPIADWTDLSVALTAVADVANDSVFQLEIADLAAYYSMPVEETALRIAFIARGHSGGSPSGQTENIYFEIFGSDLSEAAGILPAMPSDQELLALDFNIKAASEQDLADELMANPDDTLMASIGVASNLGDWQHTMAATPMMVSDSIYRLFIAPGVNDAFGVTPVEAVEGLNVILKDAAGDVETEEFLLAVTGSAALDLATIMSYASYPDYPMVNDEMFFYINGNNWDFTEGNTLSAYTGLITSESGDPIDSWQHLANDDWNNISLELEEVNDSIRVFHIEDIEALYPVDANAENVFRIAFIARDTASGAISAQTENLYFEIYNSTPTMLSNLYPRIADAYEPLVVTINKNQDESLVANSDTLYAHTGVFVNEGTEWEHVVAEWSENVSKNRLLNVNDSIARFYIFPTVRGFYGATAEEVVDSIALIIRADDGSSQSANIYIPVNDTTTLGPDAIREVLSENDVMVYPNPAVDRVSFNIGDAQQAVLNLYTVNGQLLYTTTLKGSSDNSLNITDLTNSRQVYYQVITDEGVSRGFIMLHK